MKTTIKLSKGVSLTTAPNPAGGVSFSVTVEGVCVFSDTMTPDQCGAFIFGVEQALEAGEVAAERAASIFNRPDAETPFPGLGGDPAHQCPPCNNDCSQGDTCPARGAMSSEQALAYMLKYAAKNPTTLEQLQQREAA